MARAGRALLETILELAKIDTEIDKLNARKKEQEEKLQAAEKALREAKDALEAAQKRKKEKAKVAYHIEHEIKQKEEELRQVKERLLSAKTNEEFRLLKEEEQRLRVEISEMEDKALEALDEEDEVESQIEEWEGRVRKAEEELRGCRKEVEAEIGRIERDEALMQEKRRQVKEGLPPHVLERYERVRRKVGGSPIAEADPVQQVCRGCQMQLTLQDIVEIRRGEQLIFCPYCNRILYIPEEQLT